MTLVPDDAVRTLSDGTIEVILPAETRSVSVARHFVSDRWGHLADSVLSDVELIVTELVANAIRHGAPEIVLHMLEQPFAVDVAVLDHGGGWPRRKTAEEVEGQGSGRGLAIVDRLAAAWGVTAMDGRPGKSVWVSIDLD